MIKALNIRELQKTKSAPQSFVEAAFDFSNVPAVSTPIKPKITVKRKLDNALQSPSSIEKQIDKY